MVFDLAVFDYENTNSTYRGNWVYRSNRIPDLYGHPAVAVEDFSIEYQNGIAQLEFSADETRTYWIESSTDLTHWEEIGEAWLDAEGEFEFEDYYAGANQSQFYKVLTK